MSVNRPSLPPRSSLSRLAPLLLSTLIVGPAAAQEPLPDPELLMFLAEFADEQGEVADPALLQHAQSELDRAQQDDEGRAPAKNARTPTAIDASEPEAQGDAQIRAGATSANASRARRAEKHDD